MANTSDGKKIVQDLYVKASSSTQKTKFFFLNPVTGAVISKEFVGGSTNRAVTNSDIREQELLLNTFPDKFIKPSQAKNADVLNLTQDIEKIKLNGSYTETEKERLIKNLKQALKQLEK